MLGLVAAALLTGTVRAQQSPIEAVRSLPRQTIGVMPFANISRAEADGWIGAGIAETLASDLLNTPGIEVLDLGAVRRAVRGGSALGGDVLDDESALRIGRERGATWLITGGYQRVGDRLRITTRLVEVETGTVRHTARVDGSIDELFLLEDRVVEALEVHLLNPARAVEGELARSDDDLEASPAASPPLAATAQPLPVDAEPARAVPPVTALAGAFIEPPLVIDGPPPPLPPETIARDAAGRVTMRATRLTEPLTIDGLLDERVYEAVRPASGFIQVEPLEGTPATERTEIWVLFDDERVYITARCWDSAPESQWVANDMRRDSSNVVQGEILGFLLDTFYDRRSGNAFTVNPIGGRMDGQVTDEQRYNGDWNPVWDLATGRFDGGWTVEAAIPFKSLRYRPGRSQIWGFNAERVVKWKNEISTLTPPAARGMAAMQQVSLAGTLVGLEAPERRLSLEVKPYAIGDLTSDRTVTPTRTNVLGGDGGWMSSMG